MAETDNASVTGRTEHCVICKTILRAGPDKHDEFLRVKDDRVLCPPCGLMVAYRFLGWIEDGGEAFVASDT
jgi:hypothetical protein